MNIKVTLDIKFRAFYITFAQDHREWQATLPPVIPPDVRAGLIALAAKIAYNNHGVKLAVTIG